MVRSTILALAFGLLPGAVLCSPTSEQREVLAPTISEAVGAPTPAAESLSGVVATVDQSKDTITIRLVQGKTEQFRVQDSLLFDAVRYGDEVEIAVQNIGGAKTIVDLTKK